MAKEKKKTTDKKRKQQKKPSETVQRVQVPKAEDEPPAPTTEPATPPVIVNLCDECLYEFGECDGVPKFAGEGDDRVIECSVYVNVETLPTASELEGAAQSPAAPSGQGIKSEMRVCDVEHIREYPGCYEECMKEECDGVPIDQVSQEEEPEEPDQLSFKRKIIASFYEAKTPIPNLPERPDIHRFEEDETDYGNCPGCETPLKRTAYNRYNDAIRCTNPRCRQYRNIVRTIPTGVR